MKIISNQVEVKYAKIVNDRNLTLGCNSEEQTGRARNDRLWEKLWCLNIR